MSIPDAHGLESDYAKGTCACPQCAELGRFDQPTEHEKAGALTDPTKPSPLALELAELVRQIVRDELRERDEANKKLQKHLAETNERVAGILKSRDDMKREAGYPLDVSFDIVWRDVLADARARRPIMYAPAADHCPGCGHRPADAPPLEHGPGCSLRIQAQNARLAPDQPCPTCGAMFRSECAECMARLRADPPCGSCGQKGGMHMNGCPKSQPNI